MAVAVGALLVVLVLGVGVLAIGSEPSPYK
jgi:hypothetical protein